MSVLVRCPGCPTTLRVQDAHLGRRGRCPKCGLVMRLQTPVGEALPDGATPDTPQPTVKPPASASPPPTSVEPRPAPLPRDEDRPARRKPRPGPESPRTTNKPLLLLAALAAVMCFLFVACGVGGFFLTRHLTAPPDQPPIDPPEVVTNPPAADPAVSPPERTEPPVQVPAQKVPPVAKTPTPAPTPPTAVPTPAAVPPAPAVQPTLVALPAAASELYSGGAGRYLFFRIPTHRQLVVYDVVERRVTGTISGIDTDTLVAAGREKLFIGRPADSRLVRFDIRSGTQEAIAAQQLPEQLSFLAVGSAADGPLVLVSRANNTNRFTARVYDPQSFAQLDFPIEDPVRQSTAFPLGLFNMPTRLGVSADGRAVTLVDRFYTRTPGGYRAADVPLTLGLLPAPDGKAALGRTLVREDGQAVRFADRLTRWFFPAATGPFFLNVEYGGPGPARNGVRVLLHADQDLLRPLGELPVGAVVKGYIDRNNGTADGLHRHLAFLPDPGVVAFLSPSTTQAQLFPVNLPALLRQGGRDVVFTSVPPAVVPANRAYTYTATAAAADGTKPTFALRGGPPGMTVTPDGKVTWPFDPALPQAAIDVRLAARTAAGKEAVQHFQLMPPTQQERSPAAVAVNPPPPAPKSPVVVQPAPAPPVKAPPAPEPAPAVAAAGPAKSIPLPGPVTSVAVGGAGRFICLYVPSNRQVAVFDATQAKVVKYLPVGGNNARVAAGAEKLFVVSPDEAVVQRWDLKTFEKELTVPLPDRGAAVKSALVGSAAAGPLWLSTGSAVSALDARTLRPLDLKRDDRNQYIHGIGEGIRVSADGRTLGTWRFGTSPSGQTVITLTDQTLKVFYEHDSVGHVTPGPDGRVVHTAIGRFTPEGRPIGGRDGERGHGAMGTAYSLPAAEGTSLYLNVTHGRAAEAAPGRRGGAGLAVHWAADGRKLADLPQVAVGDVNVFDREAIGNDQRFMLLPSAKLLVVLPQTNDRLLLHPFDLDAVLNQSGKDYLLVDAPPGVPAVRGRPFAHALTIKSKKGGVMVKVDTGPDGLTASADGRITWAVPKGFEDNEAVVVLTVSDASGQEVLQTLRLGVSGEKVADLAVAPKAPMNPAAKTDDPPGVVGKGPPPTAKAPPEADAGPVTVRLPGAVGAVAVGAGGKLLALHLPQQRQLAVFDAAEGKVVKYLPVAEDGVLIAAGQTHLFVANPTARVLQRISLKTFEKEATVPIPVEGTVAGMCMGSASRGPLLICPKGDQWGTRPVLVDPVTLKALPGGEQIPGAAAPFIRASADGRVFGWRNSTGSEGHDMTILEIADGRPKAKTFSAGTSLLLPSPDGRYVYSGSGVFSTQFKQLNPADGQGGMKAFLPAASGNLFMQLEPAGAGRFPGDRVAAGAGRVNFFLPGQYRPFGWIEGVEGLGGENYAYGSVPDPLMHDRRVHLMPDAGRLVSIPATNDRLVLHRFNLDELLAKSDVDYLLVTSDPPAEAARGTTFAYAPVVRSRKGGVAVKLDSGPDGMTFANGRLLWKVPADADAKEVDVILTVSDATGQEVFQTFKLTVRDRRPDEPDAPPPPPAPMPVAPAPAPAAPPVAPKGAPAAAVGPIRPTPLKGNDGEVRLPAAATDVCLGGGGRFVIYHLASTRQLAVFDVNEGKVAKYLPVGGDGAKIAAGQEKLFVAVPAAGVIQRWSLSTFEKEVTAPLQLGSEVRALLLGHASRGPLFVGVGPHARFAQAPSMFLDQLTLKPVELKAQPFHGMLVDRMAASADGSLVAGQNDWQGSVSAVVTPGAVRMSHNSSAAVFGGGPSADGRFVYGNGIWTAELKALEGAGRQLYLPAAHGPFFFSARPKEGANPGRLEFFVAGQTRSFASTELPDVGPTVPDRGFGQPGGIPPNRRTVWVPGAKLLVTLGPSDDRLFLRRVDVDDLLKATPIDYLFVLSSPPAEAVRGGRFEYALDVRSKSGKSAARLESGPPGMTVTGSRVAWDVPKDFAGADAPVILTVVDGRGQETFHNFTLAVRDPRPGERPAPAAPVVQAPAPPAPKAADPPPPAPPPAGAGLGNLTLRPAPLEKDEQTVNLPSAAGHVVPAAGGRLLLAHLPKERKLAVFDTAAARVVKYLPVAEDDVKFAAGRDTLVVLLPGANVIQRWNLRTLERELTVANPFTDPVKALAMGCSSAGPLVVTTRAGTTGFVSPGIHLYDPKTFKKSEYAFGEGGRGAGQFHPQYPPEVRVSGNGELITAWVWGLSPSGVYLWSREGKTYKGFHEHDSWGVLLPDPEGRTVYAARRAVTAGGKALAGAPAGVPVPAVHGGLVLGLDLGRDAGFGGQPGRPVGASVYLDRESRPLVTLPAVTGLESPADRFGAGVGYDQRVFLIPDAKLLVTVPDARDKLVLHRFDLEAHLQKSGIDYLFVTGRPPAEVAAGSTFRYAPAVRSKKGGARLKLETGPDGMRVGADGALTWTVPANAAGTEVDVILTVTDATGQEVFHTFKLTVTSQTRGVAGPKG